MLLAWSITRSPSHLPKKRQSVGAPLATITSTATRPADRGKAKAGTDMISSPAAGLEPAR
jgi:hypothetical protein